jgi:vacuolar-type H+-ATPase subunit E/Vma4
MALAELVLALEREAEARITAVRAEAAAQVEQLQAEAQARLARRRSADLVDREAELQAVATGRLDTVRREGTLRSLTARASALEAIRTRARSLLAATAPEAGMQRGLERDFAAALECLGTPEAVVGCRAAWTPALNAARAGRSGVRLEEREALGPGMVVHSADGRIEVDATLDGRLARLWPELAIELLREMEVPA